jgi:tubulin polyglutamylase TTLL6/13
MMSQGRGIYLVKGADGINNTQPCIVQRYIDNPLLIDNLKFDLRIYVLICGIDPLRIYMYKDGIARFSTEEYEAPKKENLSNFYMHLTNYAINKNNCGFHTENQFSTEGRSHKRSLHSIWALLSEEIGESYCECLQKRIKSIIVKTLITVKNHL